jgi:hypothetical protein
MITERTATHAEPLRCHCGSLLARLVPEGVEIKCRRCKRTVVVPLDANPSAGRAATLPERSKNS